ncbi:hypothetical protein KKC97_11800 [bacterium]|nr:hypothetical protein [bacterium]MBU1638340.1 hypothetical protein [bacterium]MBU1921221.1 hypothetical protein [bacterium]
MMVRMIIALAVCGLLLSCDKKSEEEYNPWPVWILYVHAINNTTGQSVENCISVIWRIQGEEEDQTTTCEDPQTNDPSRVKVWRPIREPLTVIYHVECEGYYDDIDRTAFFDPELAYTREGAPGDEDIESVTVELYPE